MDSDTGPGDFEIQEASKKETSPDPTHAEEIDIWEPIKMENLVPFQVARNGSEEKQWILTCWVMGLLVAWILVGLIVFAISGNGWLLSSVGMGILALPLKKVFDYYFHHPEK